MDSGSDSEVLRAAVEWLDQGVSITLVTVVRTWGSAPRRPGALMVMHADGRFVGSVSGGCIEDDLVQRMLRGEFERQPPVLIDYGVNTSKSPHIGLPCGGRLQLLVEYVETAQPLRKLLETMNAHQRISRRVCMKTGEVSLHPPASDEAFEFDGENLTKVFGPGWRLLIIGAGELTRRVAQLALTLDYAVTICDSRPEYASGWEVEGAEFKTETPSDLIPGFVPDSHCAILALAHAPVLEDDALVAALNTNAFYIGALGSHKNHQARVKRLRRLGVSDSQLTQLDGPAGLDIGSHTPAEIAIAIAAALVQTRNQIKQQRPLDKTGHG
ncbi:MAG: XdhC family protein [Thiotrichales bacterium]|nr:MAG: XdhC family protein [Thiotrichales bacterium]